VTELPECGTNDEVLAYHRLDVPGLVAQIGAALPSREGQAAGPDRATAPAEIA